MMKEPQHCITYYSGCVVLRAISDAYIGTRAIYSIYRDVHEPFLVGDRDRGVVNSSRG